MHLRNVNPVTLLRWNSTDRHQKASDITSLNVVYTENYTTCAWDRILWAEFYGLPQGIQKILLCRC